MDDNFFFIIIFLSIIIYPSFQLLYRYFVFVLYTQNTHTQSTHGNLTTMLTHIINNHKINNI